MCELIMGKNASVNRDEIAAMYRNGMSQRDIAHALGVSQTTISYNLRKLGIGAGEGGGTSPVPSRRRIMCPMRPLRSRRWP